MIIVYVILLVAIVACTGAGYEVGKFRGSVTERERIERQYTEWGRANGCKGVSYRADRRIIRIIRDEE